MKSKINIPKSFFSFLLASFLFWLLINLSKEYTTIINYNVDFNELSQEKIFEEKPIQEIPVRVSATGFKLLSANFSKRKIVLSADKLKTKSSGVNYILPNDQGASIQNQLYSGLQFQRILHDTILLHVSALAIKRIPVIANNEIDFQLGYDLASAIVVQPDSVLLSGPSTLINNITSVQTKKIVLKEVSESQIVTIAIEKPSENEKIKISSQKVSVAITVDKFTEGEFLVPFEVKNVPRGIQLNTFPKKVKVVFKVSLGNFNKITPTTFKVICDYKSAKDNGLSYLIPEIAVKSSLVQTARLSPNRIDFLIQK